MQGFPADHFLSLPRPGVSHLGPAPDTSTLAAHDFDVDVRTGFMPPQPPPAHLSDEYRVWEDILEEATTKRLKLGDVSDAQAAGESAAWRRRVEEMPISPTELLTTSETMLRRAHLVLTFILHFYVHTLPPVEDLANSPIYIPRSLATPLLQVSANLLLPPVLTYSDNVLYNWDLSPAPKPFASINLEHLHSQTTFTGTSDEEEFYLTSSRIELVGVNALALLRAIEDEAFVGDLLSLRCISDYLAQLAVIIEEMTNVLSDVRKGCEPATFYHQIRPWFRGQMPGGRPWIFEGAETQPTELSGPSAGQSSIIHVLDVFLGVDQFSHVHTGRADAPGTKKSAQTGEPAQKETPFLERMKAYMPRHHRAFLNHLKASQRPLRNIVEAEPSTASEEEREVRKELRTSYNESVTALKKFRDAHIKIATLYIINQARKSQPLLGEDPPVAKGTGGTDLVPFLKGVRDKTASAVLKN
ncbi:hypothetical protein M422DRAFT_25967 [Sphaerobolus stellatus SS14]|nr:hypothetical protein M422DRAFT_25967 [Sphaerobolus stellatus SS14]